MKNKKADYNNLYNDFSKIFESLIKNSCKSGCGSCGSNKKESSDCSCGKDKCCGHSDKDYDGKCKEKKYGGVCRHCGEKDDYPEQGDDGKICCWKCCDKEKK